MAQTINFLRRLTGVGTLARHFGADLLVIDMGINGNVPKQLLTGNLLGDDRGDGMGPRFVNKILDRKLGYGTRNIAREPAMERADAVRAIGAGIAAAEAAREFGYDIMGVGEMGIANTTTSAAVLSALTGLPAERTVGKGAGLSEEGYLRKKKIVAEAIEKNGFMPLPVAARDCCGNPKQAVNTDVIEVLARVGGFDIAAMTGVFLGAAIYRMPVVIDGYISVVAALAAAKLVPETAEFMFGSHASWEKGYAEAISELGVTPMLTLNMRLGEGSGCPLAFKIIEAACAVMNDMATFAEADINDDYIESISGEEFFKV